MRRCSKCGHSGHNKATCQSRNRKSEDSIQNLTFQENNDISVSEIISKSDVESTSQKAQRGLWITSSERKSIAGKILHVKKDDSLVYENQYGAHVRITIQEILESGYCFTDLSPKMLRWRLLG